MKKSKMIIIKMIAFSVFIIIANLTWASPETFLQKLNKVEEGIRPATNNPNFYVIDKIEWEIFKTEIEKDYQTFSNKQDSLFQIIQEREESIKNMNLSEIGGPVLLEDKSSSFGWLLQILFMIAVLGAGSVFFHKLKTQLTDLNDQYEELDKRYNETRKNYIERERLLKRELIDAKNVLEELKTQVK
jgi:hypothetical protein